LLAGTSLQTILQDEELSSKMNQVFQMSQSLVVYRCSPDEKAEIIKFVMKNDPKAFCCSIGDGANDINMIQTAHIGVGIEGNEGNQAAYFSDYSLPEFKGLRRLILWHGRSFGMKAFSGFIPQLIFSGHLFVSTMFWSNIVNGFSGINIFVAYYYSLQNVLNTNMVPVIFFAYDCHVQYSK